MSLTETLYVSKWKPLLHPYEYKKQIGEYRISLIKKDNKKKWCAEYRGGLLQPHENTTVYLPIKHCTTSFSCMSRARLEAVIWAEETLGLRDKKYQVDIPKEAYVALNDSNFHFEFRDNRKSWGWDFIHMTVQDGEKIYDVIYYIRMYPLHERFPHKWNGPKIEIGYQRENVIYHAYELLNPLLNKIHNIVENHYKQRFEEVHYDVIHRQDYRTLVLE